MGAKPTGLMIESPDATKGQSKVYGPNPCLTASPEASLAEEMAHLRTNKKSQSNGSERNGKIRLPRSSVRRAVVLAEATKKDTEAVASDMTKSLTMTANEAVAYGLVHELTIVLVPTGVQVIGIQ